MGVEHADVPALNADDITGLVRRASGRGHTGSRNRALVSVFVGAGLGVSEALSITVGDLDETGVRVRVGGGRGRSVAVDPLGDGGAGDLGGGRGAASASPTTPVRSSARATGCRWRPPTCAG